MKIDVEKLIDQVSKHPQIYNPDHKDFDNKEIRDNIFSNVISKEMKGIKGEILHRKWDKILNKYASFIKKLSNDDSSETVLERFMEWPWTKHMRIFKPYVRKQFQIPEFQPALQIPEVDQNDFTDVPQSMPPMPEFAMFLPRPEFPRGTPTPRQEFSHPMSMPRPVFSMPAPRQEFLHPLSMPRPEILRSISMQRPSYPIPGPRPEFSGEIPTSGNEFLHTTTMRDDYGTRGMPSFHQIQLSPFMENLFMASTGNDGNVSNGTSMFQNIASMIGLDQSQSDEDGDMDTDENNDTDDEFKTDEEKTEGQSPAKKIRQEERNIENNIIEDNNYTYNNVNDHQKNHNNDKDVLPDLPQPKPVADRGPSDFTAQEHIFLAWAKTMSTFTAKRQATIKMKINKIMSEAEFEDLDDEFFAANSPPRRPIYTSRR